MKSIIPVKWGQRHLEPAPRSDWFNRLWEDPFDKFFPDLSNTISSNLPSVDISEDKKEVKVKIEIPGMTEKDINLTWNNGVLSICGEKKEEKENKTGNHHYRECSYGSFCRNIPIHKNVNYQEATARCKNGVLTVILPKTESAQKAIKIKVD